MINSKKQIVLKRATQFTMYKGNFEDYSFLLQIDECITELSLRIIIFVYALKQNEALNVTVN